MPLKIRSKSGFASMVQAPQAGCVGIFTEKGIWLKGKGGTGHGYRPHFRLLWDFLEGLEFAHDHVSR